MLRRWRRSTRRHPSSQACRDRLPGVDVRRGEAESLPHDDDSFDVAAACLVVHFMADPVGGVAEMARVTRPGGWVGATVWDLAGSRAPMWPLWEAVAELQPAHPGEREFPGGSRDGLVAILEGAGLRGVEAVEVPVTVTHPSFEEWWEPYLPRRRTRGRRRRRAGSGRAGPGSRRSCVAGSVTGRSTSPRWRTPPAVAPEPSQPPGDPQRARGAGAILVRS